MGASKHVGHRLLQIVGLFAFVTFVSLRYGMEPVQAARVSDIRGTKHNLSAAADSSAYNSPNAGAGTVPVRNIKATSETQICVFCHTPHAATSGATPLWNRKVAGAGYAPNYTLYTSSSLDANQVQIGGLDQPGGSSKLCLSCHDGSIAIGSVNVLNGSASATIATTSSPSSTLMPTGSGSSTGFTRYLGTDLSNDHPISVSYNDTLANRDGDLRLPGTVTANSVVGIRTSTNKPKLKLENTGASGANQAQIQCATCHDPHIRETTAATVGNQKFLRMNRFQMGAPSTSGVDTTDNSGDIICMACHDKGGKSWAFSAHANSLVADELYSNTAADLREFPRNLPVWQAACLNCHDTHSVAGSRRLLREGTNEGTASPKAGGANSAALEETCYQCHSGGTTTLQSTSNVPNIKNEFALTRRMPITTAAQGSSGGGGGNTSEVHDISSSFSDGIMNCATAGTNCGRDLIEPRSKLGLGVLKNRHVECTDCHNPHRVIRAESGLIGTLDKTNTSTATAGHHKHTDTAGYTHTNIISGVLRGSWGVQPKYTSAAFDAALSTISYEVKRGDPGGALVTSCAGAAKDACDTASYVTREYQICLKCHSDYAYSDDNVYPSSSNRPQLGGTDLTQPNVSGRLNNSYTSYTNQAKEFQAPPLHRGEVSKTDSGAAAAYSTNNHRSWHPVMDSTGRDPTTRGGLSASNWRAPFSNDVGNQTMYCTDCHGAVTGATTVVPSGPFGPHGSNNDFLLKGPWTTSTGTGNTSDLCFRCHDPGVYTGSSPARTGFYINRGSKSTGNDGHKVHRDKVNGAGSNNTIRCNWCHVAVPHGWKNKALLVNLLDVGAEAGKASGTEVAVEANGTTYSNGPYYRNAKLKVMNFAKSGNWSIGDCGKSTSYGGKSGDDASLEWMKTTCKTPP